MRVHRAVHERGSIRAADTVPPAVSRTAAAGALRLQRLAGNRATARLLSRWAKHPDADKKGVMVPDVVAEEYARFNPPQNK